MAQTFERNTTLNFVIVECCVCSVLFGIPASLERKCKQEGAAFYCPNGHGQIFATTKVDELKGELAQAARRLECSETYAREQRERAERLRRSNAALHGVVTRTKNRISKGVCPCCNRYFANLHRHMTNQHPDYTEETAGQAEE